MKNQIMKFVQPLLTAWKKLTKKVKIIIISTVGGILALALILTVILNQPKYSILYYGMDADETKEVAAELEKLQADFKEQDGTIRVRESEQDSLRVQLANEGHPRTGFNYDFFLKNVNVMTTDQEKKIIEQYQLTQKLEYQIKSISSVRDASVTVNFKEDSGYVLESASDAKKATATVTITMKNENDTLSSKQVNGIKTLVSHSVPSLDGKDVAVIDTATGEELGANTQSTEVSTTELKLQIEKKFETDMESKVAALLSKMYGAKNVNVAVKSNIDIDKKIQEIITYLPSENNRGVISKEDTSKVTNPSSDTASGVPGTDSNTGTSSGTTTYPGITQEDGNIYVQDKASYEYLVSQVKEQIQRDSGEINDMTASVAINKSFLDDESKNKLISLVANACGIDQSKVALYVDLFQPNSADTEPAGTGKKPAGLFDNPLTWIIIGAVVLLLVTVLVIVMLISRHRKKKLQQLLDEQEMQLAEEEEEKPQEDFKVEEIQKVTDSKEQVLKKEIKDFSTDNPEIAAQLIRTWLKGDDDNGKV